MSEKENTQPTKLSEQAIDALKYNLKTNAGNYDSMCSHITSMFLRRECGINHDRNAPAPAQIDLETFEITMNPNLIGEEVASIIIKAREAGKSEEDILSEYATAFTSYSYKNRPWWVGVQCYQGLVSLFKMFLTLHELYHYKYSPSLSMVKGYAGAYCPEVPFELAFTTINVVEDSFIQAQGAKDYPGRAYRAALKFGQTYSQGDVADYGKHVVEDEKMSVYNKLYYFILRGYNEYDPDVVRMWGHPEKLGWSDETVEAFDRAQTIVDAASRCRYCCEKLIPLIYKDMLEEIDADGASSPARGSLLDGDKLYKAKNPPKGGGGDGQPEEQQQQQQQQSGQAEPEEAAAEGNADEGQSESEKAPEGKSKGKESAKPDAKGEGKQDDDPSGKPKQTEKGINEIREKDSESKTFKSEEEILNEFKKGLKEACDAINKRLNEVGREDVPDGAFDDSASKSLRRTLDAVGCGKLDCDPESLRELPKSAQRLYEEASSYMAKLFNQENYVEHRLEQGEVDEAIVPEWYTEKNHRIYQSDVVVKQGRKFQLIFILDCSGSMCSRFYESAKIIAALAHAFDDVGMQTAVYLFGTSSVQIKSVDDEIVMRSGGESSLYESILSGNSHGNTNPSGCFDALTVDPTYQGDETKIVFFLTDGAMDNRDVEAVVQEDIDELTSRGNWYFMCIGIDFSDIDLARLSGFTRPAICRSYETDEIATKLAEDIYNVIVDDFVKA